MKSGLRFLVRPVILMYSRCLRPPRKARKYLASFSRLTG
jgi:hypothetical protein